MGIPIIGDIIGSLVGGVKDVVSEVVVDKDKRNQINADLERLRLEAIDKSEQRIHEQMIAQTTINLEEAKSENTFVAGWRPAIGWIGAVGMGYSFVLEPFMSWSARVLFEYAGTFPSLNYNELLFFVAGMLGFGGLRTYEKVKGVSQSPPDSGTPVPSVQTAAALPEDAPWANK